MSGYSKSSKPQQPYRPPHMRGQAPGPAPSAKPSSSAAPSAFPGPRRTPTDSSYVSKHMGALARLMTFLLRLSPISTTSTANLILDFPEIRLGCTRGMRGPKWPTSPLVTSTAKRSIRTTLKTGRICRCRLVVVTLKWLVRPA